MRKSATATGSPVAEKTVGHELSKSNERSNRLTSFPPLTRLLRYEVRTCSNGKVCAGRKAELRSQRCRLYWREGFNRSFAFTSELFARDLLCPACARHCITKLRFGGLARSLFRAAFPHSYLLIRPSWNQPAHISIGRRDLLKLCWYRAVAAALTNVSTSARP